MSVDRELSPGIRVGNYLLGERIGAGAFAEVWRATHHEQAGKVVAVKIATNPTLQRQLAREGRLHEIDHPNIVPIIDSDTRGGEWCYVVMPFMSGGSLRQMIDERPDGGLIKQVGKLTHDILRGLSELHRLGMVHRDIKPANILLDEDGRARIADFGLSLASISSKAGQMQSILQSVSVNREAAAVVGTLAYMAPEVREGEEATPAADVFGVGVLLFELLVGRRPQGIELPSQAVENLPHGPVWDALYFWACRPKTERYPDAGKMLEALRNGPRPIPFAGGAAPKRAMPARPKVVELPSNAWDALLALTTERERRLKAAEQSRKKLADARQIYAPNHAESQSAQAALDAAELALETIARQFDQHCQGLVTQLEQRLAKLQHGRVELIASGCLPKHPEIVALDKEIGSRAALRDRLEQLPRFESTNPLLELMRAWRVAESKPSSDAYGDLLERFGKGLDNPWAARAISARAKEESDIGKAARREEQSAERAQLMKVLRVGGGIGSAIGFVAGALVGAVYLAIFSENVDLPWSWTRTGANWTAFLGAVIGAFGMVATTQNESDQTAAFFGGLVIGALVGAGVGWLGGLVAGVAYAPAAQQTGTWLWIGVGGAVLGGVIGAVLYSKRH